MTIDRQYVRETLQQLVRANSINPTFSGGTTSERAIAALVAEKLRALGMDVGRVEPEPERVSVVGTLRGRGGGASVMLYAHMDTVGIDGMPEPFSADVRDGRLYGRGAYDMKGGLTACLAAVKSIVESDVGHDGDILIAAVADEEVASIGMQAVLESTRADHAIVTEATELDVCIAHKGFCWIEVETHGVAAHGSRFDEGIDANMRMGRFLHELEKLERALRYRAPHALVGPPSLHAAVIHGGSGTSTYAERCRLEIERRMIPGETPAQVMREIQDILAALGAEDESFRAAARMMLAREPFESLDNSRAVKAVRAAARDVRGVEPATIGQTYWMDAAFLAAAGIDTVVIGPAGHGAHAAEEWVDLDSVSALSEILARATVELTRLDI
jgi:acetylornithine deacetylase